MARINIDDALLSDPRFRALSRAVGSDDIAIGLCARGFRTALKYWGDGKLIPERIWKIEGLEQLIEVDLAERRQGGVYVRGSDKQFEWYRQRVNAGRKRGSSARRNPDGTFAKDPAANQRSLDSRDPPLRSEKDPASYQLPLDKQPATDPAPLVKRPATYQPPALYRAPASPSVPLAAPPLSSSSAPPPEEKKPEQSSSSSSTGLSLHLPTTTTTFDLLVFWNLHCGGLPKAARLTRERRALVEARIAENPDVAFWIDVIKRIARSASLNGSVKSERFPQGWKATFDWLIENETNAVKVSEGAYNDPSPEERRMADEAELDRLLREADERRAHDG